MTPIHREAARLLPVSPDGEVLLTEWHDPARADDWHWMSVGGAIEPGETPQQAAVREMREETGIGVSIYDLSSPLGQTTEPFSFGGIDYVSHETHFAVALGRDVDVVFDHLEPAEIGHVRAAAWWRPEELEHVGTAGSHSLPGLMRAAIEAVGGLAFDPDWSDMTLPRRLTARVLPVSPAGAVLLLEEQDPVRAGARYWCSIGGGIGDGESAVDAAVREMLEETGIVVDPGDLVGPVSSHRNVYSWGGVDYDGEHTYFAVAVPRELEVDLGRLEPEEVGNVLGGRWWTPSAAVDVRCEPPILPDVMRAAIEAVLGEP